MIVLEKKRDLCQREEGEGGQVPWESRIGNKEKA